MNKKQKPKDYDARLNTRHKNSAKEFSNAYKEGIEMGEKRSSDLIAKQEQTIANIKTIVNTELNAIVEIDYNSVELVDSLKKIKKILGE